MKNTVIIPILLLLAAFSIAGCGEGNAVSDAFGTFEATEVNVTPEVGGRLLSFGVMEGERVAAGQSVAQIDTMQAHLERLQLEAQREAVRSRLVTIRAQAAVYREQIAVATRELERTERMLAGNAATQKQYDDLSGQVRVLERQLESVEAQRANVNAEIASIEAGIARIDDRIARSSMVNPVAGTVLARYAEAHEMVAAGRPLYRIADLETMQLRVFVSGSQLPDVRIGAGVTVLIDGADGRLQELPGEVSWISDKAEFTPRTIQTREERVNLVYAVKIRVPNPDGRIKIGMPGEVVFTSQRHPEQSQAYHPEQTQERHPERSPRSEATRAKSKGVGGLLKASRTGPAQTKPVLSFTNVPHWGDAPRPPRASTAPFGFSPLSGLSLRAALSLTLDMVSPLRNALSLTWNILSPTWIYSA